MVIYMILWYSANHYAHYFLLQKFNLLFVTCDFML